MPFRPDPFLRRFERLRGMRARRGIGYAAALIGCAGAVGARWSFGSLLAAAPFTTFYPAIGLAALLGGPRAGVLALVLSAVSADYFFMPPYNSWAVSPADAVATGLFLFVGGLIIGLIALLNEAVDRLARGRVDGLPRPDRDRWL